MKHFQPSYSQFWICFALLFWCVAKQDICVAQSYQLISYQTDQGLPNNLVKGITQDLTGFIWIATDGGISRFDGKNFVNFKKELPSNYTKGFLRTRAGKILCINDGGLTEVQGKQDGAVMKSFLVGGQNIQDEQKTIYPKDAIEDCKGSIWIAESTSILRWQNGKTKRYNFDEKYIKNDFTRSFRIIEATCGQLFVTAHAGFLFRFDEEQDKFNLVALDMAMENISDATMIDKQTLWIGDAQGVTEVKFTSDYKQQTAKRVLTLPAVSAICMDKRQNVFVGTWKQGVYQISQNGQQYIAQEITESKANVINHIFTDIENNLWLCTNDGLEFLKPNAFKKVPIADRNAYLQSISYKQGQALLVCEGSNVHQIVLQNNTYESKKVYNHSGNLYGLTQTKNKYYIGTGDGKMIVWQKGNTTEINLSKYGQTVNQLYTDRQNQIWICQYDRPNGLLKMDSANKITFYSKAEGLESPIYTVTEAPDGVLYAGGEGNAFLYRWNTSAQKFENISQPIPVQSNTPVRVKDMIVESNGNIWLATNLGLWLQKDNKLSAVNLGKRFAQADMSSVSKDKEGNLWIGSELGLIKYKNEQVVVFEKVNGLSNVNISPHGILNTDIGIIFVATTNGFNYSIEKLATIQPTPPPVFLTVKVNNQRVSIETENIFEGGITFQADFVSFTYPNQPVLYQYRLLGISQGDEWIDLGTQNQIIQPRMPAGTYKLEVRAKQQGNHAWSAAVMLTFRVNKLWYLTYYAIMGYVLLGALLIWVSVNFYTYRLKQQKATLSKRIMLATREIQERAQHLHEANTLLLTQKEEIQRQKEGMEEQKNLLEDTYKIIQMKNSKITDSIRYARTIQTAVLPEERTLAATFRDHFVLYRPKDVVSGDFYWLLPYQNRQFIAVVDCTGHGVPGAFMSMIGHTLLYRIIKLKGIANPAQILSMLHNEVRVVLRQKYTTNVDGMDVCLCVIEKKDHTSELSPHKVTFAGAKLPLYYVANNSLEILEEDRRSIGGIQSLSRTFTNKEIVLQAGDILYMRSDGIVDQNNIKRKKFGENQFNRVIENSAHLPMPEQRKLLEEALDKHQEGTEQRDDITVLGIKL